MKRDYKNLEDLFKEWEKEAELYKSLKEIEEWYKRKSQAIWESYQTEIQRLIEKGVELTADVRDRVAKETKSVLKDKRLFKLYDSAVKELLNKSAGKLLDSKSKDYKEIIQKYDKAWKELAKR